MADTPKWRAAEPDKGVYRKPTTVGETDLPSTGEYRRPALSGAVDTRDIGEYDRPPESGVRDSQESNPYRHAPMGAVGISDIRYVPYGNVYERSSGAPGYLPSGGAYEVPRDQATTNDGTGGGAFFFSYIDSDIYPLFVTDSMTFSETALGGYVWDMPHDPMTLTPAMLGGTIVSYTTIVYNCPPEGMLLTPTMDSGTILSYATIVYNCPPEGMILTPTMDSGTILNVVLYYTNWIPEGMLLASTMSGGTLV